MRRNYKKRFLGCLALLLALSTTMVGITPNKVEAQDTFCEPDILFVGARGSGQPAGLGEQVQAVYDQFLDQKPPELSVDSYDLGSSYRAVDAIKGYLTDDFESSVLDGMLSVHSLMQALELCDTAPSVVMVGYSQGAEVIKRAVKELPDSQLKMIGAVVTIGDPRFGAYEGSKRLGDSHLDCFTITCFQKGIRGTLGWAINHDFIYSLCLQGDPVCDAPSTDMAKHTDFYQTKFYASSASVVLWAGAIRSHFVGDILRWEDGTSWQMQIDGRRHIPSGDDFNCFVDNGSRVLNMHNLVLLNITEIYGEQALCSDGSSSSGGGSSGGSGSSSGVGGYYLPYPAGVSHIVTQAPGSQYSHVCPGNSCQAIDFDMSINDPISANKGGTVYRYSTDANNTTGLGKYVMLIHDDGWCSIYGHMNTVAVAITNGVSEITRGQVIGFAGETGVAFGVHTHFALVNCSTWQSVNVDFVEVADPLLWESYTSQNTVTGASYLGSYDGDGIADRAIYRPSDGEWRYKSSLSGDWITFEAHYGGPDWLPAPGDYDGDGITDRGIYKPNNGEWRYRSSLSGQWVDDLANYGGISWLPAQADYDGDGITDRGIYRPSDGEWRYRSSQSGDWITFPSRYGGSSWLPTPGDYDGDGTVDRGIYRPSDGEWRYRSSKSGKWMIFPSKYGGTTWLPAQADYDGDGITDRGIYRPSDGEWRYRSSLNLTWETFESHFGGTSWLPAN